MVALRCTQGWSAEALGRHLPSLAGRRFIADALQSTELRQATPRTYLQAVIQRAGPAFISLPALPHRNGNKVGGAGRPRLGSRVGRPPDPMVIGPSPGPEHPVGFLAGREAIGTGAGAAASGRRRQCLREPQSGGQGRRPRAKAKGWLPPHCAPPAFRSPKTDHLRALLCI